MVHGCEVLRAAELRAGIGALAMLEHAADAVARRGERSSTHVGSVSITFGSSASTSTQPYSEN